MQVNGRTPGELLRNLRIRLMNEGYTIKTDSWQGSDNPPVFLELLQQYGECYMLPDEESLVADVKPMVPWAQQHFAERVQGFPTNPDPSHTNWLKGNEGFKMDEEKFSHTYSERLWPHSLYEGIRFPVGDLNTVVEILKKDPHSRQIVMPMFMHEDLSASLEGERVPCSLSWNFIVRGGYLHCTYTMRSVDAVRHAHNDFYFANMLTLWLIEKSGLNVKPGKLSFLATSFHCFLNDKYTLNKLIEGKQI